MATAHLLRNCCGQNLGTGLQLRNAKRHSNKKYVAASKQKWRNNARQIGSNGEANFAIVVGCRPNWTVYSLVRVDKTRRNVLCNVASAAFDAWSFVVFAAAAQPTAFQVYQVSWHVHAYWQFSHFFWNTKWFCRIGLIWRRSLIKTGAIEIGSSTSWRESVNKAAEKCSSELKKCHWVLRMDGCLQNKCIDDATIDEEIKYSHTPTGASPADAVALTFLIKAIDSAHTLCALHDCIRAWDSNGWSILLCSACIPFFHRDESGWYHDLCILPPDVWDVILTTPVEFTVLEGCFLTSDIAGKALWLDWTSTVE